jgi:hypothetical protein
MHYDLRLIGTTTEQGFDAGGSVGGIHCFTLIKAANALLPVVWVLLEVI